MKFQLHIGSGSQAGRVVEIQANAPLSVGRTRAMLLFPDDATMSGLHFELGCDGERVALRNYSQTNGTHVNGDRVEQVILQSGDVITAGATQFILVAGGESAPAPAQRVQSWVFPSIPPGWEVIAGQGLRYVREGSQPATVLVTEEKLPADHNLEKYIEIQLSLIANRLPNSQVVKAPAAVPDVDGCAGLLIRTPLSDGRMATQQQVYACIADQVGILTATVSETETEDVHRAIEAIFATALFKPEPEAESSDSLQTQPHA